MSEESKPSSEFPLVYAVVPAFNRCDKTLNFLRRFREITYPNKKVAICDDGSSDQTAEHIRLNFPDTPVLFGDGNLWWSGGTNRAIEHALKSGADYILTINDDVEMEPDFLSEMVKIAQQNPKYIVGCRIHQEDARDRIWSMGTTLVCRGEEIFKLNLWDEVWESIKGEVPNPYPVTTMPGNGVLIPAQLFKEIGLYDEKNMPHYHADSDLVLRAAKRGYLPVISTGSVLYNHILREPLVRGRKNVIFAKKSDRYYKAVWTMLRRHGPWGKSVWLFYRQYDRFFLPRWVMHLRHAMAQRKIRAAEKQRASRSNIPVH